MNPKNVGNRFITYTVLILDSEFMKLAINLVTYLVLKGHKVTVIHDHLIQEEHEQTKAVESTISASDVVIIFFSSSFYSTVKSIMGMKDNMTGVRSIGVSDVNPEEDLFVLHLTPSDFSFFGYLYKVETERYFCSPD